MDATSFLERLRDDHETALSRLGSSKAVYALTGGEMDADHVRTAAADELAAVAAVVDGWADDASGEPAALFADVAETLAGHDVGPADHEPTEATALAGALEAFEATPERLGALAAALTVLGKEIEQFVGFFVGDADPTAANEFRDVRGDVEDARDRVAEVLAAVAEDEDWDAATTAADAAVEAAYDWYVETLEGMGVKPKNVC